MKTAQIQTSILDRIGNTALIELKSIVPDGCARILLKLEAENPTGSMKDRMALAMIEAAEERGVLEEGGHVVEYTAGSTGVSLALVCAVKGYTISIVTSDAFSIEKRNQMLALGADVTIVRSVEGRMDEALTRNMIEVARQIAESSKGYWTDQLNNAEQIAAYHKMGEEIWSQTNGRVDAFVQSTGTSASVRGVAEALHRRNPKIHCVAVEPSESAVLSGGDPGEHKIEGVGAGFVVPLWRPDAVDEIAAVSTGEAMETARMMAKTDGVFAGTSTGGNVAAAIKLGQRLGPGATVVTLMCDSGAKYLSTLLYRDGLTAEKIWDGNANS